MGRWCPDGGERQRRGLHQFQERRDEGGEERWRRRGLSGCSGIVDGHIDVLGVIHPFVILVVCVRGGRCVSIGL